MYSTTLLSFSRKMSGALIGGGERGHIMRRFFGAQGQGMQCPSSPSSLLFYSRQMWMGRGGEKRDGFNGVEERREGFLLLLWFFIFCGEAVGSL